MHRPPLVCPISRLPLEALKPRVLVRLQDLAQRRALRNEAAQMVPADFAAAWMSSDGQRAWLVRDGFIDFRPGEAVLLQPQDFLDP